MKGQVVTVLGTRPELVKLAPIIPLLDESLEHCLVHTGQHYSAEMDAVFFRDLDLRQPDVALQVGSGSHATQTGAIMVGVERTILDLRQKGRPPRAVIVLGDTNTTLGAALAAVKVGVPVVHLEAGCRSFVPDQPEEINRVLVDHCARHLLAPDEAARQNLLREGIAAERIAVVGSTSVDAALRSVGAARGRAIVGEVTGQLGLKDASSLLLCTVHRAENTVPEVLAGIVRGLNRLSQRYPIAFAVHPRTQKVLAELGEAGQLGERVLKLPPLGYLDLLALLGSARALLTDSGGLQEEAAAVGTPALVLRGETEWSYLVQAGRNALIGNDGDGLYERALACLSDEANRRMRQAPCDLGTAVDERTGQRVGTAGPRIVAELLRRV